VDEKYRGHHDALVNILFIAIPAEAKAECRNPEEQNIYPVFKNKFLP